jgi:hypothetical protein
LRRELLRDRFSPDLPRGRAEALEADAEDLKEAVLILKLRKTYSRENHVKEDIRKLLDAHNWFHWAAAASSYSQYGIADRIAYRGEVLLAIEAKFGSNKPSPLQKAFLQSILAEGGFAFVVNEKNIHCFQQWLDAFDRSAQAVSRREKVADEDGALMLDCIMALTETIVEK